jgi:hypothetical protein
MHNRIKLRLEWESDNTSIFIVHQPFSGAYSIIDRNNAIIAGILTGGNKVDKKSQDFSMEDIRRMAQSESGKQLMELIRQYESEKLEKAVSQASAGDLAQAKQTLSGLLSSPDVQALLKQLGR